MLKLKTLSRQVSRRLLRHSQLHRSALRRVAKVAPSVSPASGTPIELTQPPALEHPVSTALVVDNSALQGNSISQPYQLQRASTDVSSQPPTEQGGFAPQEFANNFPDIAKMLSGMNIPPSAPRPPQPIATPSEAGLGQNTPVLPVRKQLVDNTQSNVVKRAPQAPTQPKRAGSVSEAQLRAHLADKSRPSIASALDARIKRNVPKTDTTKQPTFVADRPSLSDTLAERFQRAKSAFQEQNEPSSQRPAQRNVQKPRRTVRSKTEMITPSHREVKRSIPSKSPNQADKSPEDRSESEPTQGALLKKDDQVNVEANAEIANSALEVFESDLAEVPDPLPKVVKEQYTNQAIPEMGEAGSERVTRSPVAQRKQRQAKTSITRKASPSLTTAVEAGPSSVNDVEEASTPDLLVDTQTDATAAKSVVVPSLPNLPQPVDTTTEAQDNRSIPHVSSASEQDGIQPPIAMNIQRSAVPQALREASPVIDGDSDSMGAGLERTIAPKAVVDTPFETVSVEANEANEAIQVNDVLPSSFTTEAGSGVGTEGHSTMSTPATQISRSIAERFGIDVASLPELPNIQNFEANAVDTNMPSAIVETGTQSSKVQLNQSSDIDISDGSRFNNFETNVSDAPNTTGNINRSAQADSSIQATPPARSITQAALVADRPIPSNLEPSAQGAVSQTPLVYGQSPALRRVETSTLTTENSEHTTMDQSAPRPEATVPVQPSSRPKSGIASTVKRQISQPEKQSEPKRETHISPKPASKMQSSAIKREPMSTRLARKEQKSASDSSSAASSGGGSTASQPIDLDALASDLYPIVKQMLAIETERL